MKVAIFLEIEELECFSHRTLFEKLYHKVFDGPKMYHNEGPVAQIITMEIHDLTYPEEFYP